MTPAQSSAVGTAQEVRNHTVLDFLRRPVLLETFTWNSGSPATFLLSTHNFPGALTTKPMIKEKLQGFAYMRGSQVYRIQVNATPFQQGRLIAIFVPYGSQPSRRRSALEHLGGLTGFPHIDLDLSKSQTMALKIPFVSSLTHMGLASNFGTIGQLRIYVYSPLAAESSTSCEVSVWAHFDDIEAEIPCGSDVTLQNGEGEADKLSDMIPEALEEVPWKSLISLAMTGRNKPLSASLPHPTPLSVARHMANGTGIDTSKPLSLMPIPGIAHFPGKFGNNVDEMKLSYLFQTPTFLTKFAWSTSSQTTTLLKNILVTPMFNDGAIGGAYEPTMLAYCTAPFLYWTGSLVYTFKFVKTNFHSGRLMVTFNPDLNVTYDRNKCYRHVFDMKEKSEFEVRVPFVWPAPWAKLTYRNLTSWEALYASAIGQLDMTVLNQLVAPGVTSNSIECLIEVRGGEDYRVAVPYQPQAIPVCFDPPSFYGQDETDGIELHVFEELVSRDQAQLGQDDPLVLFRSATATNDLSKEEHCVGEVVESVRDLIKRFAAVQLGNKQAQTLLDPYFVNGTNGTLSAGTYEFSDLYSWFSYIYAFQSGGMRVKVFWPGVGGVVESALFPALPPAETIAEATSNESFTTNDRLLPYARNRSVLTLDGCLEVEIPFYSPTYIQNTRGLNAKIKTPEDPSRSSSPRLWFSGPDGAPAGDIYRACSDDFSFGYLVGAPKVTQTKSFPFTVPNN